MQITIVLLQELFLKEYGYTNMNQFITSHYNKTMVKYPDIDYRLILTKTATLPLPQNLKLSINLIYEDFTKVRFIRLRSLSLKYI